jgi:hypothetical protein
MVFRDAVFLIYRDYLSRGRESKENARAGIKNVTSRGSRKMNFFMIGMKIAQSTLVTCPRYLIAIRIEDHGNFAV